MSLANYHMHDIAVESATPGRLTLLITYTDGRLRNDDRLYLVVRIEDERKGLSASAGCYVRMRCALGYTADIIVRPAHSTLPANEWVYPLCRTAMRAAPVDVLEPQIAASGMTWARVMAIFCGDVG